jgi:uncharacterized protein YqhQ
MKASESGRSVPRAAEAAAGSASRPLVGNAGPMGLSRAPRATADPASDPALRMGGIALKNGLILVSERNWAAAIRDADGTISVTSGQKPHLPGTGESGRAGSAGIPLVRGLGRFGESLVVLGLVKKRLPTAELPFEGGRVAAALAASMAATTAVRAAAPRSALVQEAGTALAAFIPAVLSVKGSAISGYHGAEHKVIGAREEALRAATRGATAGVGATGNATAGAGATGDAAAAAKEHDRCGSNLVGPYLFATVLTNLLARGRSGQKTPVSSALAGAASLGLALEAMRWAGRHGDSLLARLMLAPGRAIQKSLTTTEPTAEQLAVGERALKELLRLENAAV